MEHLKDYSHIRGVCHNPDPGKSKEQVDIESLFVLTDILRQPFLILYASRFPSFFR